MAIFYFAWCTPELCYYGAMLYTHSIGNQPQNTMVVFKMHDSVPSPRYSPVCNVLRQWKTSLIPTYRVYRLYDIQSVSYCSNSSSPVMYVKADVTDSCVGVVDVDFAILQIISLKKTYLLEEKPECN